MAIAKRALEKGQIFGMTKDINVIDISIKDQSLLVNYLPDVINNVAVYMDIIQIMGFLSGLVGDDLESKSIFHVGVQAIVDDEPYIHVISPLDSVKAAERGDAIYWMKNSLATEPFMAQKKILLLVEGETESSAYPILFESLGFRMDAHRIELFTYAEKNLRSVLLLLVHQKEKYYLTSDNDKTETIGDLKREGVLEVGNYHILEHGEFEDYVSPEVLASIFDELNPGIGINIGYISEQRSKGKKTSKIISDYYYQYGRGFPQPTKPEIGVKIAEYWVRNEIPDEVKQIITNVMNIT